MPVWTIIQPPRGGLITAPRWWWVRAWRWTDHDQAGQYLWVTTKLFVGPWAYDRAAAWSKR